MTYVHITWLAQVLRAEGCVVAEYAGWVSRGRPASAGGFNPVGVLWHHTGTTTSTAHPAPTTPLCIDGRSDLPGPLCHGVIGYDGVIRVIAGGRANHAGVAKASGPMPAGDGNELYVGFEIDYDGTQKMSTAQYDAAIKAGAAVVRYLKRSANNCRGHKETSVTGKWDPGNVNLNDMRAAVNARLAPPVPPYKPPAPDPGDVWMAASDVWEVPLGKTGFDMGVAMQRMYTWTSEMQAQIDAMQADIAAIKAAVGVKT